MELDELRRQIDAVDRKLVELLNERARLVEVVGKLKKRLGMEIYIPEREREILDLAAAANGGPFSGAAISRLFERILDESRSLERKIADDAGGKV
ncbi:MAG TPA: chorismate mutase [candidate division Zixibacteria bacterium]|nr:chorismate mutase [candidate division Zixibacteria bacterium]